MLCFYGCCGCRPVIEVAGGLSKLLRQHVALEEEHNLAQCLFNLQTLNPKMAISPGFGASSNGDCQGILNTTHKPKVACIQAVKAKWKHSKLVYTAILLPTHKTQGEDSGVDMNGIL